MTGDGPSTLFRDVAGVDLATFPLLAERLAIDATNALRAADSGLRGLRGRPFLRRLWDGVTNRGQELVAAIGQDLAVVQRATLGILREIMREEARTQYCVNRVLVNLHAIHDNLDVAAARVERLEAGIRQLQEELLEDLRVESRRLTLQIEGVRREVHREAFVRRLTELYRARDLHAGAGETLSAGMFMAAVSYQYWGTDPQRREEESRAALAVVKQRLATGPLPLEDALLRAVEETSDEVIEPLLYLGQERGPHLAVLEALAGRRMARLTNGEANAAEALAVVRATRDPERQLESRLVRPIELAQSIARELLTQGERGEQDEERNPCRPTFARSL